MAEACGNNQGKKSRRVAEAYGKVARTASTLMVKFKLILFKIKQDEMPRELDNMINKDLHIWENLQKIHRRLNWKEAVLRLLEERFSSEGETVGNKRGKTDRTKRKITLERTHDAAKQSGYRRTMMLQIAEAVLDGILTLIKEQVAEQNSELDRPLPDVAMPGSGHYAIWLPDNPPGELKSYVDALRNALIVFGEATRREKSKIRLSTDGGQ